MDIVLGVAVTPTAVRMVLVEGDDADGVTVDQDGFAVGDQGVPEQVVSAVLGTREGAREGGYRLTSTGVAVGDQRQASLLRAALAERRVNNVTLVSAFLAAAALTQTVGAALGYARTALLFVQPHAATVAVVESADGAITELRQVDLPASDVSALAELTALTAGVPALSPRPDGTFVVGAGVDVGRIKATLEAASTVPLSVPEEPDTALARGAALASAHAPLFNSSTSALAWARDPGTGPVDPDRIALGYNYVAGATEDYDATAGERALAYSAVGGDDLDVEETTGLGAARITRRRRPMLVGASAVGVFVVLGVTAAVVALAVGIGPTALHQPDSGSRLAIPAQQAPPPRADQPAVPAPPPVATPAPPVQPPAAVPASSPAHPPVPVARQAPAAPAPAPPVAAAPAPAVPEAPPVQPPAPAAPAAPPVSAPAVPVNPPAPAAPPVPIPIPIPIPLPALVPALVPAPVPAAPSIKPAPSVPILPPIFKPPASSSPQIGGRPGIGGDRPGGWPGAGAGKRGGAPGWPGGGGGGRHGLPF